MDPQKVDLFQAEKLLLGALLDNTICSDGRAIGWHRYDDLAQALLAEHFADRQYGDIFAEIGNQYDNGTISIDIDEFSVAMQSGAHLPDISLHAYLKEMAALPPLSAPMVAMLAARVITASILRQAIKAADRAREALQCIERAVREWQAPLNNPHEASQIEHRMREIRSLLNLNDVWPSLGDYAAQSAVSLARGHTDIYGEPMLMTTSLDREEVYRLANYHEGAWRQAIALWRTAEEEHHARRAAFFREAIRQLGPGTELTDKCPPIDDTPAGAE